MIKLLFIHWKLVCGGAEMALFDLIQLLDKSIFDITVFVIHDGGELEKKFKDTGIKVINSYSELKKSKNIADKIHNAIKIKKIEKIRSTGGKGLLEACIDEKFDIIISYHTQAYCGQAGFPLYGKKIKYVHGSAMSNIVLYDQLEVIRDQSERFDRIICVSESAKNDFIKVTGIRDNVVKCFNPINSEKIIKMSKEVCSYSSSEPYICAVGRLSEEKGYERLIRIHKRLIDEGFSYRLVIVGDGSEREKLAKVVNELNINDYVTLVGYSENPYPYILNSKFLVISSFTEGLPVVAMESLCLKVPVVSSHESVSEIFGDEPCGIVTESDDESLYQGIKCMLSDQEFYSLVKESAEKRSEYFAGNKMIKEVEKIYIELMNESGCYDT